jgi:hypothetical protein
MGTLTIRLPTDKHARPSELARNRSISINKLTEELATISIAEFEAETRFRTLAARGSAKKRASPNSTNSTRRLRRKGSSEDAA